MQPSVLINRTTRGRVCSALTLLACTFIAPADAAPQKQQMQFQGVAARIDAFWIDGCRMTILGVFGSQQTSHDTATGRVTSDFVSFFASTFDPCIGAGTSVSGFADGAAAAITGNVQKGVRITAQVAGTSTDPLGVQTPVTGTIDVTLTPTGQPSLRHSQGTSGYRGFFQSMRFVGTSVDAATTGSVLIGGTDFLALAAGAGADISSFIGSTNSGMLTIIK